MKLLGGHLSISKGIHTLQRQMTEMDAETCAVFLKNQRTYKFKEITKTDVEKFRQSVGRPELILPHGSYLLNLANAESLEKSWDSFIDDLTRCNILGIKYYNIHPGADVHKLGEGALDLIAKNINRAMELVPDVVILLENMAGQGTVCGRTFEELNHIIENVETKERIGVTLDTCHLFGAGYDIRTAGQFADVMKKFDDVVGLKYLKAVHLNDSKAELGSRKDRHEQIGKGKIGMEAFQYIMNSPIFDDIIMVLETPDDLQYPKEIALLRSLQSKKRKYKTTEVQQTKSAKKKTK